jgi:DNA-binding protein H-NS
MQDYENLAYQELKELHRNIGALLARKKTEALHQLQQQAAILGFSAEDLAPPKLTRGKGAAKYRDPSDPQNVWSGRGKHPAWLKDALEQGRALDEFLVGAD